MKPVARPHSKPLFGAFAPVDAAAQAQAKFRQAWSLQQGGQLDQVLELYEQVLRLQPKHFDALHMAGVVSLQLGQPQRAVDLMTRAIKVDWSNASAYNNRGAAYAELHDDELACINYSRAIELRKDYASAYNNRGCVLTRLNRHAEALADLDQAIAIKPDYFEAFNNRGIALIEQGRHTEALSSFESAVRLNPQCADAHWNLGMANLRLGHFDRGWRHYEWRLEHWRQHGWSCAFAGPRWEGGDSIEGRTVLVFCEQGLGDTIQFARYAPMLVQRGARVVFQVQDALFELLRDLPGVHVVARSGELPAYDCHAPLLSLPGIFRTDLASVPAPPGLPAASPEQRERWRAVLGPSRKPRIGIAWSGSTIHVDDYKRSISLRDFSRLISDDFEWVSLQLDVRASDRAAWQGAPLIRDVSAALSNFCDTQALCEQLDLIVTVDTSVAHLAATIGKPTWLLLPHCPDWRWLTERDDSPWYSSLRLFRQTAPGDWQGVLQHVKAELQGGQWSAR